MGVTFREELMDSVAQDSSLAKGVAPSRFFQLAKVAHGRVCVWGLVSHEDYD